MRYKTLNGWLRAVENLASHMIINLKGSENIDAAIVGSLTGEMYNGIAEIRDLIQEVNPTPPIPKDSREPELEG